MAGFFDKRIKCVAGEACLILMLVLLSGALNMAGNVFGAENGSAPGKKIYEERCMICHGTKGDGKGLVGVIKRAEKSGRVLDIRPRDFTTGVFRFRSTPTGCLPDDRDLMRLVDDGHYEIVNATS